VQIVKYSYQAPEEPLESFSQTAAANSGIDINWPVYGILVAILLAVIFLVYQPFREQLTLSFGGSSTESSILAVGNNENPAAVMEDQQLLQAAEHLKLKRLDKALQIYQAVLQNNSQHVEAIEGIVLVAGAYQEQGERAYRQQKWKEARRYFQKSLTLRPADSELSRRIRECNRFLKRKKSAALATGKSDETDSGNEKNAPPRAELLVEEFNSSRWQTLGLYEHEDYRLQPANLTFFNNLKVKKFFYRQQYEAVEMSVMAKALSVGNNARYGVIFAHNTENTPEYQNFYLFTIDNAEHFALQKVVGTHVKTIISEVIKPGIIGSSGQVYLRLKALDNFVLLYANGELLKMVSIDESVKGGVGLYVDPKLRVEFSKIKISPAEY
jgi:tetratricopeptide (TPR) repeat protein